MLTMISSKNKMSELKQGVKTMKKFLLAMMLMPMMAMNENENCLRNFSRFRRGAFRGG